MKLFKSRKLSIVLALVLVLTSFSFTAMAAEGDVVVKTINDLGTLYPVNDNLADANKVNIASVYDEELEQYILQYTSEYYGPETGTYNAPGAETRHYLVPSAGGQLVDGSKKYLKIEFDVKIKNVNDGIAFRMGRYGEDGELLNAGLDSNNKPIASDNFFVIGGSKVSWNSVSHGFRFRNQSLTVDQWHHVVMELGTAAGVDTVKFYVDGQQVTIGVTTTGNEQEKAEDGTTITNLPTVDDDGTAHYVRDGYGFGGASGNRCAMIPASLRGNVLDTKLAGFTMTATDTPYDPSTFVASNELLFKLSSTSTAATKNVVTFAFDEFTTPDFDADYKTATVKITHPGEANINTAPGSEPRFSMVSKEEQKSIIDYTKHKNLRVKFNVYINESTSSVYFRTLRTATGTYSKGVFNYVFCVGGADSAVPGFSSTGTGSKIHYKGLSVGEWHNVVMDLGTGSDGTNDQIIIYVDGQPVENTSFGELEKDEETKSYGFGTYNPNFCIFGVKNISKAPLEVYLSDVSVIASNETHSPAAAPSIDGVVRANDSTGGLSYRVDTANKAITYVENRDTDGMSVADFKVSNVDYVGPTDTNKVIAYNDASKRVAYYTLSEQTETILNQVVAEPKDGRLYIKFDYYNPDETLPEKDYTSYQVIAAYYNKGGLKYLDTSTWATIPLGLSASSYDLRLPSNTEYDEIKVFVWAKPSLDENIKYTLIPRVGSATVTVPAE